MNHIYKTTLLAGLCLFFYSTPSVTRVAVAHGVACRCSQCLAAAANDFANNLEPFVIGGDSSSPEPFRTQGVGFTSTATQPNSAGQGLGQPSTLTWSITPDGTRLPGNFITSAGSSGGVNEPSSLIDFLDGIHHNGASPGGDDLQQRAWWGLFNSAFQRWDELSGVTFQYESNDDGAALSSSSLPGVLGTRGDIRIGGHPFDGQTSPTILAFNYFPNNGDMVIDTDEIDRWSDPTNNFLLFRNTLMHEIGHGLGLRHVESFDVDPNRSGRQFGTFLLEPTLASGFDGPQFDDILGIHRLYGDRNEEGNGNDTYLDATSLGNILPGETISIGTDAVDLAVAPDEVDFVSIDGFSDTDFFSFTIDTAQTVNLLLTPLGPTYEEGPQGGTVRSFNAAAQNNLSLGLFDTDGTSLIEFSNEAGLGLSEDITNQQLEAGEYFVRISGQQNAAQFFQLDVSVVPEPTAWCLSCFGLLFYTARRRR